MSNEYERLEAYIAGMRDKLDSLNYTENPRKEIGYITMALGDLAEIVTMMAALLRQRETAEPK